MILKLIKLISLIISLTLSVAKQGLKMTVFN
jgi:hypothetical protein